MSRSFRRNLSEIYGVFRSAIAVSAAVEAGRPARTGDLVRLGLDPEQFGTIRHR
ncbi:MAG: hypothetical protein ACT6QU_05840 [Aliihoeflea sp.]|uniref:hypothetical protein n=1 Tax=Aliihoeflea sp. TaxID=2608088 RepID=UPI004037E8B3